jgi:hypothetical protein
MRRLLILLLAVASPAAACDMDGMFGFNHYAQMAGDAAAADAMREAAIAQARDNFMARHGLVQTADASSAETRPATTLPVDVAVNVPVAGTPQ